MSLLLNAKETVGLDFDFDLVVWSSKTTAKMDVNPCRISDKVRGNVHSSMPFQVSLSASGRWNEYVVELIEHILRNICETSTLRGVVVSTIFGLWYRQLLPVSNENHELTGIWCLSRPCWIVISIT